ncbi:metal-sensing transcriptional repressor [Proteiniclasticum ruminis]|uniref:DNA-binding transcriptional regulator, FrmR family n=1 Tax=Proteiniclasticum ruminis TaxID=398199 RepID=A0A1G8SMT0_9CLOT|nr:metal-sensing transcriptional repressor [Proteiniclasticum ruminis]SDJ30556.1 DNA-binding transcriptional regulator, FrmR family [Proteiniclasticum ruminis]
MVDKKKMINRISRAEGQLRGITKMLEEERDCREVVIQLAAVKASVEKVIHLMVTENLMNCVVKDGEEVSKEKLEEALELIFRIK